MSFRRAEVIEIYSNPAAMPQEKIDQLLGHTSESSSLPPLDPNPAVILTMPRDTIRARVHGDKTSILCYPFFPSHLRLPVKVGEEVWIFQEPLERLSATGFDVERNSHPSLASDIVKTARNPATVPSMSSSLAYWICRPTQERQTEDLNYTAYGRAATQSGIEEKALKQRVSPIAGYMPEFRQIGNESDDVVTVAKDKADLRQRILDSLETYEMEPVARFTKQPGDTVLAGSHDSRIVLGSLRSGPPDVGSAGTGTVDIVAGTGRSADNSPNVILNEVQREENHKDPAYTGLTEPPREGDPDILSDASRILITESAPIDNLLGTSIDSQKWVDTGDKEGPSVAVRTQHVRVVASESGSVRITVEGPAQSSIVIDADGNIQIASEATVSIQSSKIFLGTESDTRHNTGILVGAEIRNLLIALRNDLLSVSPLVLTKPADPALPPMPVPVGALLSATLQAMPGLGDDLLLDSLFSKTVFASS